jgi:Co/Zn/Cd efflux system component
MACDCRGGADANMRAIFLHILADTLGSCAVLASTLAVQMLHWHWADPVASVRPRSSSRARECKFVGRSASAPLADVPAPARVSTPFQVARLPRLQQYKHRNVGCGPHWQDTRGLPIPLVGSKGDQHLNSSYLMSRIQHK